MEEKRLIYLLEQYHTNQLTEEEAIELERWHQQEQDNTTDWIDEINIAERDRFIEVMSADIMQKIGDGTVVESRRVYKVGMPYWAAAAAVLLLAGLFWLTTMPVADRPSYAQVSPGKIEMNEPIVWDTVVNNTSQDLRFILPDSSVAVIATQSGVSYQKDFTASKREIFLIKGKALFNVRKNAQRPFIVYSHDISTTALGTSFTVSSYQEKKVNIQLHEGKVVVQVNNQTGGLAFQPVYMTPGDEVNVNTETLTASIIPAPNKNNYEVGKLAMQKKTNGLKAPIVFEQDSLSYVFTQLSAIYGKKIEFDRSAVSRLDFSGIIKKEDKLTTVLHKISLLNNLSVKETSRGYIIRKK
jgi:transmembrane sensor